MSGDISHSALGMVVDSGIPGNSCVDPLAPPEGATVGMVPDTGDPPHSSLGIKRCVHGQSAMPSKSGPRRAVRSRIPRLSCGAVRVRCHCSPCKAFVDVDRWDPSPSCVQPQRCAFRVGAFTRSGSRSCGLTYRRAFVSLSTHSLGGSPRTPPASGRFPLLPTRRTTRRQRIGPRFVEASKDQVVST